MNKSAPALGIGMLLTLSTGLQAGRSAIPHPDPQAVVRAQKRWPQATRESLNNGRSLYVRKCSGCHPLRIPSDYSEKQWDLFVARMAVKARLSDEQQQAILQYLVAFSSHPAQSDPASGASHPSIPR